MKFKKERLDPQTLSFLEKAVRELSSHTKEKYELAKAMFGRFIVARNAELIIGAVTTYSRPAQSTIVVVDEKGTCLLPSIRHKDFEWLCHKLGYHTQKDILRFNELVHPEVGDLR